MRNLYIIILARTRMSEKVFEIKMGTPLFDPQTRVVKPFCCTHFENSKMGTNLY